jgi:hypothetical protein
MCYHNHGDSISVSKKEILGRLQGHIDEPHACRPMINRQRAFHPGQWGRLVQERSAPGYILALVSRVLILEPLSRPRTRHLPRHLMIGASSQHELMALPYLCSANSPGSM